MNDHVPSILDFSELRSTIDFGIPLHLEINCVG